MNVRKLAAALTMFVCGAVSSVIFSSATTVAQIQAEAPPPVQAPPLERGEVGRYQISAYGTGSTNEWGCYRIDTLTGDTWRSTRGARFMPVRK
jgi:hypothetical protein